MPLHHNFRETATSFAKISYLLGLLENKTWDLNENRIKAMDEAGEGDIMMHFRPPFLHVQHPCVPKYRKSRGKCIGFAKKMITYAPKIQLSDN